ncbi:MAG: DUF3341 domain-containing protein [Planctomycetota bacterium]|nr:DUF3341 domain-containing protein [Phycisphaerales bacterium]
MGILGFPSKVDHGFRTPDGGVIHGVMAEFGSAAEIYHAAEKLRDAGFQKWDVFSPFPIHGIDEAMGIKRTILPWIVACGAITGVSAALLMQWWMSAVDYPIVVQGKPYDAWEPFVPITFELGVLFSAFSALIGMLALNGLPRWNHPLFKSDRFLRVSDDAFVVVIEAGDPKFQGAETVDMLQGLGASDVELVEE